MNWEENVKRDTIFKSKRRWNQKRKKSHASKMYVPSNWMSDCSVEVAELIKWTALIRKWLSASHERGVIASHGTIFALAIGTCEWMKSMRKIYVWMRKKFTDDLYRTHKKKKKMRWQIRNKCLRMHIYRHEECTYGL